MRRSRWLLMLSFVVISSMLAWACGGGGEEKPGAATAPAATSPAGNTPAAAKTSPAGETPSAQGGGAFADLAGKFGKSTFKVTYQLSGGGAAATQGSMTWYKKGDNLREDFEADGGGQQGNVILIIRPDTSYYCTEMPETGEGDTCFSVPTEAGGGVGDMVAELEKTLTDPNLEVVSTSSRKIAGEDAKCYTVRSPDIEGEAERCMSGDGVPLFWRETTQGVETTMEATDFSRDVSDSDFEPPYPVSEEMPSLPEGQ